MVGDSKRLDHIVPLADGGLHHERNLQWILDTEHKAKTAEEGFPRTPKRGAWLPARGSPERPGVRRNPAPEAREREPYQPPDGKTAIQRRFEQ